MADLIKLVPLILAGTGTIKKSNTGMLAGMLGGMMPGMLGKMGVPGMGATTPGANPAGAFFGLGDAAQRGGAGLAPRENGVSLDLLRNWGMQPGWRQWG
jgi:hypothetical protein